MKLIIDENIIMILGDFYLKNYDLQNYDEIQKQLFKIIKNHSIDISGYYNVFIYHDQNYGLIIEMQKEDLEYLDYFNNQIEFNIEIIEDSFLYKIDDLFTLNKKILKSFSIYKKKSQFYLEAKTKISSIDLGIILENSQIVYGQEARKIKKNSTIIAK